MRVQLIHPPVYLNVRSLTALRPTMPLGLAYVAGALRRAGHRVAVLDAVAAAPEKITADGELVRLGLTTAEIVARLDPEARAFGLTNTWSFSWPLVRELIHAIKAARPDVPIVCGGEHFTGLAELSLRQAPIDAIVLGEGEEIAVEVFGALEQERPLDGIDGVARLVDGRFTSAPRRARNRALDDLPWPAWDLFDPDTYHEHGLISGLHAGMTVPILATRGCPYQCTFCSSPAMWTTRYYTRDPRDVADEIEHYYRQYGARNFPFHDLTAIVKRQWIVEFCQELLRRDLRGITWQFPSGTRCEVIDDEVADLLHRTGGRALAYAPESGSEETRRLIKKQMKTKSLLDSVRASVRHGLNITIFLVIGFPHDTAADLRDTARLVRKLAWLGIDDIAIGFFFPIPNTELFHQLLARDRITLDDRFLLTPIHAAEGKLRVADNYCEHLTARQLTWWKRRLWLSFYGVSFAVRPWRIATVLWHALRGRETRKLETFLVELKRKGLIWLRGRLGRLSADAKAEEQAVASR